MNCEEFSRKLDNYENLTDEEKLSLNEHAIQCPHCREELDFMLEMIAQLNALPKLSVPSDFGANLSKRLDLENQSSGAFAVMLNSVRRNYKRYSTAAACLVLAVVIGANGKSLIDRWQHDDGAGNVPVVSNNSYGSEDKERDEAVYEENVTESAAENKESGGGVGGVQKSADAPVSDSEPVKIAAASNNSVLPKSEIKTISPAEEMSESIDDVYVNPDNKPSEPVYTEPKRQDNTSITGKSRMIDENAGISVASIDDNRTVSSNYTIARGVYRLPNPEIAEAEASSIINDTPVEFSKINDNAEATIARGRYYISAEEGNIAIDNSNKLGVNSEDAQRAAELIQQYADIKDDSYYVINSENIPSMLEHMEGEGINYQNNMENSENEKVSFKLVIE